MPDLERQVTHEASRTWIPRREQWPDGVPCPLLTADGCCGGHTNRPAICRLYGAGATANMQCEHGMPAHRAADRPAGDRGRPAVSGDRRAPGHAVGIDQLRALAADRRLRPVPVRLMSGDTSVLDKINATLRRSAHP